MPHKHKRARTDKGDSFDLPPTTLAKPLPAYQRTQEPNIRTLKADRRQSNAHLNRKTPSTPANDTPKSFARLLAFQHGSRLPSGLDDGKPKPKPKKRKIDPPSASEQLLEAPQPLRIHPTERLSDFARRVDQSLPLHSRTSNSSTSAPAKIPGLKPAPTTKHNKRLLHLQKSWREEAERRKAKQEAKLEDLEERREEEGLLWMAVGMGRKKRRMEDEDPWAVIKERRQEMGVEPKGLRDVVEAPPKLNLRGPAGRMFREVIGEQRVREG